MKEYFITQTYSIFKSKITTEINQQKCRYWNHWLWITS